MPKSVVAISKDADPEKMVAEVFALLGGVENLVKPRSTVVLKPNAGHPAAAETSVNTSPGLVAAVIKEVMKAKPKEVIVAEAAAIGCDSLHVLDVSGIGAAAEAAGARLIDIKREKDLINIPIRDARSDLKKVKLPRFLLEAEHLFNLPIFKSHASMVFTCALKNMKGVVQDITHQQMHMTDLAAAMMDVWSVIRADLTIADLIRPAEGFGPHTTIPVDFGCVVASKDPVALDATACRMVGLGIDKVAYFAAAAERNLGYFDEENIEVVGRTIDEVHKDLWFPYLEGFETWPEYNVLHQQRLQQLRIAGGLHHGEAQSLGRIRQECRLPRGGRVKDGRGDAARRRSEQRHPHRRLRQALPGQGRGPLVGRLPASGTTSPVGVHRPRGPLRDGARLPGAHGQGREALGRVHRQDAEGQAGQVRRLSRRPRADSRGLVVHAVSRLGSIGDSLPGKDLSDRDQDQRTDYPGHAQRLGDARALSKLDPGRGHTDHGREQASQSRGSRAEGVKHEEPEDQERGRWPGSR